MKALCSRCRLAATRMSIVRGRGVLPAPLLLIGEGPGVAEDMLGMAFVGPAGRLHDQILKDAGYSGPYYVTNVVHCHPTDTKRGANRPPTKDEALACMPRVLSVVEQCNPKAVVLWGKVAENYYKSVLWQPLVCLPHPAALLRAGGVAAPGYMRTVYTLQEFLQKEGLNACKE